MSDIRERLHVFDGLEVPDQWSTIEHREPWDASRLPLGSTSVAKRVLVGVVAIVLAVASFLALTEAFHGHKSPATSPTPGPSATLLPPGTIVYASGSTGSRIFTISTTGDVKTALTPAALGGPDAPFPAIDPAWSPGGSKGGTKLAFSGTWGTAPGNHDLYVMNADGSQLTRITQGFEATHPSWSPTGARIAFAGRSAIWSVGVGGGSPRGITPSTVQHPADPAWSPDARQIAFDALDAGGVSQIFVIQPNGSGSGLRQLTACVRACAHPAWSPDGSKIVYTSESASATDLSLMASNGSHDHLLAPCGASACALTDPSWNEIRDRIIYNCNGSLCAIHPNGSNAGPVLRAQVAGELGFLQPSWQPQGTSSLTPATFKAAHIRSIPKALAFIRTQVDVPVALPDGLPRGVTIAPMNQPGGVVYETPSTTPPGWMLHLVFGTEKHVYIQFGATTFDGCGPGPEVRQVRVGDAPALLYVSTGVNVVWSELIWPATRSAPVGRYGLSGSLSPGRILQLARTMPAVNPLANATASC